MSFYQVLTTLSAGQWITTKVLCWWLPAPVAAKLRPLTHRIAHLIGEHAADPAQILAVPSPTRPLVR